jgi:hypothetical protein
MPVSPISGETTDGSVENALGMISNSSCWIAHNPSALPTTLMKTGNNGIIPDRS